MEKLPYCVDEGELSSKARDHQRELGAMKRQYREKIKSFNCLKYHFVEDWMRGFINDNIHQNLNSLNGTFSSFSSSHRPIFIIYSISFSMVSNHIDILNLASILPQTTHYPSPSTSCIHGSDPLQSDRRLKSLCPIRVNKRIHYNSILPH